eukprot:TRINITY_DN2429_c0_g1_i3.p1 TRINITY_DN2429_c0_g1~~TRINITY_DN2429_c0_g1_i3.p1  ORF type:complete len:1058 (+),score=120.53 TRINITY_DN2429_c0_g1_i3:1301-4474(+)
MSGDEFRLFITTSSGYLLILSWCDATGPAVLQALNTASIVSALSAATTAGSGPINVSSLNCSTTKNEIAATFTDGSIAVMTYTVKTRQRLFYESFSGSRTAAIPKITNSAVASLNSIKGLLAVSHGSTVCLHDIYSLLHKKAILSLESWNYSHDDLGDVSCMAWSPDQEMIAVGYSKKGMAVFHWTGVCVMTPLARGGSHDLSSQHITASLLQGPPKSMCWAQDGYNLIICSSADTKRFIQLDFAKSVLAANPVLNRGPHVALTTSKGIWLFRHPNTDCIKDNWEVLSLPPDYAVVNCPLKYISISADGQRIAACGTRGCVIYDKQLRKWKLFGVQEQENEIEVIAPPIWCSNVVICLPVRTPGTDNRRLIFFPRYYLDKSSLLHTIQLQNDQVPVLLDCAPQRHGPEGCYALVCLTETNKVLYYNIKIEVDSLLRPSKAKVTVVSSSVLELQIPGAIASMRLLPSPPPSESRDSSGPPAAVVLTHRGEVILISFILKWRAVLARNISQFWIDPSLADHGFVHLLLSSPKRAVLLALLHPHHKRSGAALVALRRQQSKEGKDSMQSSSSSLSAQPAPPHTTTLIQDADQDACPIGVLTNEGLLINATEGLKLAGSRKGPSRYHVHARTIPYLHAVLLALFIGEVSVDTDTAERQACASAAVEIAKGLHNHSFFVDVMDYLLHAVLHCHEIVETQSHQIERSAVLKAVLRFLSNYAEFHEVLVHCLRKADPGMWPLVFAVCPPLQLFDGALHAGRVRESALLLRVLQMPSNVDDPSRELRSAAAAARRLFPLAISRHMFELSAELLRFLNLLSGELLGDDIIGVKTIPDAASCLVPVEGYQHHDPLINSSLLRNCVINEGKQMLATGCLRDLHDMFDLLGLNVVNFIKLNWSPDTASIGKVFCNLHSQFAIPFARYTRPLPKGVAGEEVDTMLAGIAGHPRLLYQLKQLGGITSEVRTIASSKPHIITPAQIHLVLVPHSLTAIKNARQTCIDAGCSVLVFLLSLILLDIPSLVSQVASHGQLIQALKSPDVLGPNAGYAPLIQWLDKRRMDELQKLL